MAKLILKRPDKSRSESNEERKFTLLPEGKYRVQITAVEEVDDRYGGLALGLKVLDGDFAGTVLNRLRVFPNSSAANSLSSIVEDIGDLDGLEVNVYLGQRPGKKGGTFNFITRFTVGMSKNYNYKYVDASTKQKKEQS